MATTLDPQIDVRFPPTPNLLLSIQKLLRKLWLFYHFQHRTRLITVDVPFRLKSTPDGRKIAVLLKKAWLPRKYPLGRLLESKHVLEETLGTQVEILQKGEWIVICLEGTDFFRPDVKNPFNSYIGAPNEYKM